MEQIVDAVRKGEIPPEEGLKFVWELCNDASKRQESLDPYVSATDAIMALGEPTEDDSDVISEFYARSGPYGE